MATEEKKHEWYLKNYYKRHGHLPFRRNTTGRFSGLNYENTEEKIEAIKEKYKNGVPKETMDNFFNGRGFFRDVKKNDKERSAE